MQTPTIRKRHHDPIEIKSLHPENHSVTPLPRERLEGVKAAYTTRAVPLDLMATLIGGEVTPKAGDLVLARIDRIGQHTRLELGTGRKAPLFVGDEVLVCYGHRYAPDQFEAEVPESLEPCHLVAAGGVAARVLSRHSKRKQATRITPLGLVGDRHGRPINLTDWSLPPLDTDAGAQYGQAFHPFPLVIASVGTAMNAGKTTAAAYLIRGLVNAGLRVGAAKLTGTGAGGDRWLMQDAGACKVLDFTDAGHVSTHKLPLAELERITTHLTDHLQAAGVDLIVVEVADGLYQEETAALLRSPTFRKRVDGILFCAGDAMGAAMGVEWLRRENLPVFAVAGSLTASPLACREVARAIDLPVLDLARLADERIYSEVEQWLGMQILDKVKVMQ